MDSKPSSLSRRRFLKRAAATAAATGFPTIIPSGVLAAPGRPGANDRIRIGHIGVGGMGTGHVQADAVALCDVDSDHLANAAKRVTQGTPFLCKDYRELLDRKDVDAVMIATPDHWHAIMAVQACQAGKDVYSEKPTCKTIQEGQAMVNAAHKYGRVVQIGAQGRSQHYAHAACEYLRNGQIGKVSRVEIWHPLNFSVGWGQEQEPPPTLDWNMWLGPARVRPYNPQYVHFNFRWMMDFGAGFIRDRGNHAISIVMWCMNADSTGPVSVEATGTPPKESCVDAPMAMDVKWEFKNPDWTLTWSQPGDPKAFPGSDQKIEWGAKYYGDKDTLIVAGGDGGGDTEKKAYDYTPPADGQRVFKSPGHRENWLDCIRTREKPVMTVETGYKVVILPIIANISYLLGRKLQWDAAAERFVGDEEANRMLAQPYRAPWHL